MFVQLSFLKILLENLKRQIKISVLIHYYFRIFVLRKPKKTAADSIVAATIKPTDLISGFYFCQNSPTLCASGDSRVLLFY